MHNVTSFTNEHSTEFVLVPDLVAALDSSFRRVVPSYFWFSREGGRIARESLGEARVRVLTAYARRPKVRRAGDDEIVMRINPELYAAAATGAALGCPVLAGVPVVSTLTNLVLGAPCRWFRVNAASASGELDEAVRVDLGTGAIVGSIGSLSELTAADIVDIAREARPMAWADAVDAIRALRGLHDGYRGWWGRATYKPFHLLLLDE